MWAKYVLILKMSLNIYRAYILTQKMFDAAFVKIAPVVWKLELTTDIQR